LSVSVIGEAHLDREAALFEAIAPPAGLAYWWRGPFLNHLRTSVRMSPR